MGEARTEDLVVSSSNPAETYERFMVPPLFAPAAERLLDIARPRPGERVLDVGCGTGIVARSVASRLGAAGTVIGLDLSPGMLEVARLMSEQEGLTIAWHEGRAEALPFPDGSFDLVLCQFALMFFADRRQALRETLGPDVSVPLLQYIAGPNDAVRRVFVWPLSLPVIVPDGVP